MAGIIAIYGLVVSVIIGVNIKGPDEKTSPYTPYKGEWYERVFHWFVPLVLVFIRLPTHFQVSCISAPVLLSVFLVSLLDSPSGSSEMPGSEEPPNNRGPRPNAFSRDLGLQPRFFFFCPADYKYKGTMS